MTRIPGTDRRTLTVQLTARGHTLLDQLHRADEEFNTSAGLDSPDLRQALMHIITPATPP